MCSVYGESEGEKPELNTRKWVTMADGLSSHFIPGQVENVTTSELVTGWGRGAKF